MSDHLDEKQEEFLSWLATAKDPKAELAKPETQARLAEIKTMQASCLEHSYDKIKTSGQLYELVGTLR